MPESKTGNFLFPGRIHSCSRMLYRVLDIRSGVECIFGNRFTRPRLKYADNSTLFVFYNHKYYAVRLGLGGLNVETYE